MYWLLNISPLLIEILILLLSQIFNKNSNFNLLIFISYFMWILAILPIYLLIVNFHYLKIGRVSHIWSLVCMLLVIALRVCIDLINHKIKFGEFIGDVPEQIYCFEIIIPAIIIIIGLIIRYYIKISRQ